MVKRYFEMIYHPNKAPDLKVMNSPGSEAPSDNDGATSPTVSVTNSETIEKNKKFTVYKVVVEAAGNKWFVFRRYNEFSKLLDVLKRQYPNIPLKLPGKKLFGNNFSSDFIKNRRQGLNEFVQKLVTEPSLLQSAEVREFLNVDKNLVPISPDEGPLDKVQDLSEALYSEEKSSDADKEEKPVDLGPKEKKNVKPSDFEFLKVIGKGSFGRVLLAKHKIEGNVYAVKNVTLGGWKYILSQQTKGQFQVNNNSSSIMKKLMEPRYVS
ncbi:hypothetical protein TNCV_1255301 [Trichonephila clavipes]|nr:hypothetical protein TNCV_1255301 [Trichonephila clavipes]